jgi:phosphoglycolate phosphatase-like HAD superfamily hydrolase
MASQTPQPGLLSLMTYLESHSLPKGICTRNFDAPVNHLLSKFLEGKEFHPIVTRDFRPPKPDPAGILHIAKSWGLITRDDEGREVGDGRGLIMVGYVKTSLPFYPFHSLLNMYKWELPLILQPAVIQ